MLKAVTESIFGVITGYAIIGALPRRNTQAL
jgi:hypothetical protein